MEKAFSFMIRVRMPGGVITAAQWLTLDHVSRTYGNDTMRLTTRQTVQLHGIIKSNLKATLQQTNSWSSGYCANVDVTNLGSVTASTWTVVIELNQASIYTSWNGTFSGSGSRKTITPVGWNALYPGAPSSPGRITSCMAWKVK